MECYAGIFGAGVIAFEVQAEKYRNFSFGICGDIKKKMQNSFQRIMTADNIDFPAYGKTVKGGSFGGKRR